LRPASPQLQQHLQLSVISKHCQKALLPLLLPGSVRTFKRVPGACVVPADATNAHPADEARVDTGSWWDGGNINIPRRKILRYSPPNSNCEAKRLGDMPGVIDFKRVCCDACTAQQTSSPLLLAIDSMLLLLLLDGIAP
jgi:hypothetical protein